MTDGSARARQKYLDLLFFTGFALLVCHELDAVAQAEWRLLPGLNQLSEDAAYSAFVVLHIPLFALLMWCSASKSPAVRLRAQLAIDGFMAIHAGLHMLLVDHEHYAFHSALSVFCIFGAGAVGLLHAVLAIRARRAVVTRGSAASTRASSE